MNDLFLIANGVFFGLIFIAVPWVIATNKDPKWSPSNSLKYLWFASFIWASYCITTVITN